MFELDHLFVWTDVGGPVVERLVQFGLTEGSPNTHPGQGTECRRFFFREAYLELVWIANQTEAQTELVVPAELWQRWSERGARASPFGLCLRPTSQGSPAPFLAREYSPPYLPAPLIIHVGKDVPVAEPWWFYLDIARRPDRPGAGKSEPLEHTVGFRKITGVRFSGPSLAKPSQVGQTVAQVVGVTLAESPEHLAEITFDGGGRGGIEDFRPLLPLVFRW